MKSKGNKRLQITVVFLVLLLASGCGQPTIGERVAMTKCAPVLIF